LNKAERPTRTELSDLPRFRYAAVISSSRG
jgi:hypothetical protein